ncbi:hypothetical protein BGZ60DRAFT_398394 [Tricladium varicosporioides]|nr:hypothetical protein BGZ60DRAFT_398394 [Hymenoscyphus varicosporioides]
MFASSTINLVLQLHQTANLFHQRHHPKLVCLGPTTFNIVMSCCRCDVTTDVIGVPKGTSHCWDCGHRECSSCDFT